MRDNVQVEGPEDYIRKSITVPFLDYTLNEMKSIADSQFAESQIVESN
jgi:hypothetical protein